MSIEPIVKTIHVKLPPERAFRLFTEKMGTWWPVETHSVSAGMGLPSAQVIFHTHVGGKIEEVAQDGSRHIWGHVTEWVPGTLVSFTWHPGKSEDRKTNVRVEFVAENGGTRVTLSHEGWENLSDEDRATHANYDKGWIGVLARYQAAG